MTALPPGPTEPGILQLVQFSRDPAAYLDGCFRRYGDMFTLRAFGPDPIVYLASPEGVRDVFAGTNDDFSAGAASSALEFLLGRQSVATIDGDPHTRVRKLMIPPLHGERMVRYGARMREITAQIMRGWRLGEPFSVREVFRRITVEVMVECVFGIPPGAYRDRLHHLLVTYIEESMTRSTVFLYNFGRWIPLRRALVDWVAPLSDRLPIPERLPVVRLARTTRELDAVLYEDVRRRRAEGTDGRDDIMSMLLGARDENGEGLTDDEMHDDMLTLLVAGHDTTTTMLSWTLSQVLRHAPVLADVERELDHVFGGGPIDPEKVRELSYLEAVIKESLRLFPVSPSVGRRLSRPARVGGCELPAGVHVGPSIYLLHRNPAVWPSPERFDPTRFLERKPKPYEFIPFGGGQRVCAGLAFALYEMKIVLATIFSRATLRLTSTEQARLAVRGFVLGPSTSITAELTGYRGHDGPSDHSSP